MGKFWLTIAIVFFITGMAVWYTEAVFNDFNSWTVGKWWVRSYYLWDKICWLLAWLAIYNILHPSQRKIVLPLLYFLIVRILWEFVTWKTGLSVNNSIAVAVLFLVLLLVTAFYMWRGFDKIKQHMP